MNIRAAEVSKAAVRARRISALTFVWTLMMVVMGAFPAWAQVLDKNCTASIQNRNVIIADDGTFVIPNIPVDGGLVRVRVYCKQPDGTTVGGMTDFFSLNPNGQNELPRVKLGTLTPLPSRLELVIPRTSFTTKGDTSQLITKAYYADGNVREVTSRTDGTTYTTSNAQIATVSETGLVTVLSRGQVIISARNEGALASVALNVLIPNDADGDGMPDEWERTNGLNPLDPSDAAQDIDGDGLTNLQEFQLGTNPRVADTDGDGLSDGDEVRRGTNPLDADSDRDGLKDGEEVKLGTDPLNADTDGDKIRDGIEVKLGLNPLNPDATTLVRGRVVDSGGNPLAGAAAVVFNYFNSNTDATGVFTIGDVPATLGSLTVLARQVKDGQVYDGTSNPTSAVASGTTDVGVIQVGLSSGVVNGQVLDPNSRPVVGARVVVTSSLDSRTTTTDQTGAYRVANMAPSTITVSATDPTTGLRGSGTGALITGQSATIMVTLQAAGTINGTVFKRDGSTPAAAGVTVKLSGSKAAETKTDALGKFGFDFVPLGSYSLDAADAEGNHGRTAVVITRTGETAAANISFLARGTVSGTVRDGAGNPVGNANVQLTAKSAFEQSKTTNTDGNGFYSFTDVFIGTFTVTANNPLTKLAGQATGTLAREAQTVTADITIAGAATITGTVYRANSTTAVPGAQVTVVPGGMTTVADNNGRYRFDYLPLASYTVTANELSTGDTGRAIGTLATQDQTLDIPVTMVGQGKVVVTVLDGAGTPVPTVALGLVTENELNQSASGTTQADGTYTFDHILAGKVHVYATKSDTQLTADATGTVTVGATTNITVKLPGTGIISGFVYQPDGKTPAPAMTVMLPGRSNGTTATDGSFRFEGVPFGTHSLTVMDSFSNVRATASGIVIGAQGQEVKRNLILIGLGTVSGRVTRADGTSATGASVVVQSNAPGFLRSLTGQTDVNGNYSISGVPVGTFGVTASLQISPISAFGNGSGSIGADGASASVDIQLSESVTPVQRSLRDANGMDYSLHENGAIRPGAFQTFNGDGQSNSGGMLLDIIANGQPNHFIGQSFGTSSLDGRETTVSQNNLAGLNVSRRIYIPTTGYFARYIEVLKNPGAQAVTVDVQVSSYYLFQSKLKDGLTFQIEPRVTATSSGDTVVDTTDPNTADHWVIIDDDDPTDPFLGGQNLATVATVFDQAGAQVNASASFNDDFDHNVGNLTYTWKSITVPAGGTVELMHFVAQQLTIAGAQASADRLVQLAPEALVGLTADDAAAIRNFNVPSTLTSTVASLPSVTGAVRGRVFASDSTTLIPNAKVDFHSNNPIYGRHYLAWADATGFYSFVGNVNGYGPMVIPVAPYQVQATHPETNAKSLVLSSDFATDMTDSSQDIIFSNTGMVTGTVYRGAGVVVTSGELNITGGGLDPRLPVRHAINPDGTFTFSGLTPGTYNLGALVNGTQLTGSASTTISQGQVTTTNVIVQSSGGVQGTVRRENGDIVVGVPVTLRLANFASAWTQTDTAGHFSLTDLPTGQAVLESFDQTSNTAGTATIAIADDTIVTQDITLTNGGTVTGVVHRLDGATVPGAQVSLISGGTTVSTTSDSAGTFTFNKVAPGGFELRAFDPATNTRGRVTGDLGLSGQTVSANIYVIAGGTVSGTVVAADGTTPILGATVDLSAAQGTYKSMTTDASGTFSFDYVPVAGFSIRATTPNGDQGAIYDQLTANGETRTVKVVMNGLGTVTVNVQDASGNVIPNASVGVSNSGFSSYYSTGTTDASGNVTIQNVLAGDLTINATDPASQLAGSAKATLAANASVNVSVQLEPAGTVQGKVFDVDGTTPVIGMQVMLRGTSYYYATTAGDGSYRFNAVRLGTYTIEVTDGNNHLRARETGLSIASNGYTLVRNLKFVGLGNVVGHVTSAVDGSPVSGIPVLVRSQSTKVSGFFSTTTDDTGQYQINFVPVGPFTVTATDTGRKLTGSANAKIDQDGQNVTVDLALQSNLVTLPLNLKDANDFLFDIQPGGYIASGTNYAFGGGYLLSIIADGTENSFYGDGTATSSSNGRELAIQLPVAGLNVTRRVYIPDTGYFGRYIEVLDNPGDTPITVGVKLWTGYQPNYRISAIATSSGDQIVDNSDNWIVTDDDDGSNAYPNSSPTIADVFAGAGARTAPTSVDLTNGTLVYSWDNVTIPAGGSVAFMHFAVQQFSQAGATASAQRLVQLPPEALDGIDPSLFGSIMNFAVPSDGSSPLPRVVSPTQGAVSGHVFASDRTTPIPSANVEFRSGNLLFGRVATVATDDVGAFSILAIPVDSYTLTAKHPETNVTSTVVNGSFAVGGVASASDIVFSNTGMVNGKVLRSNGTPVSGASVTLSDEVNYSFSEFRLTKDDGSFVMTGLAAGTYPLHAITQNALGTGLSATANVTVTVGATTDFTVSLPPSGSVVGTAISGDGNPVPNAAIIIRNSDWTFYQQTITDASGAFVFPELPAGTLILQGTDPVSNVTTTLNVTIVANATTTQQIQFIGIGSVQAQVNFANGTAAAGSTLEINETARDSGFRWTGVSSDATGAATITNVTVGNFIVRAHHPSSSDIYTDVAGAVASNGQVVPITVALPATGTVHGRVTRANGTAMSGVTVGMDFGNSSRQVTTDANGNYTMPGIVGSNLKFSVYAAMPGTNIVGRLNDQQITADGESYAADIVMPAVASVYVSVQRADGTPVQNATVFIRKPGANYEEIVGSTDSSGGVTAANVQQGSFTVRASDSNYTDLGSVTGTVVAADDLGTVEITITAGATGTVTGTVYAADGATPASNIHMKIFDVASGGLINDAYSANDGTYLFSNVSVAAAGFRVSAILGSTMVDKTGTFSTNGATETVNFTLPIAVVKGNVKYFDGTVVPFPNVYITQTDANNMSYSYYGTSDADGNYTVAGASSGAFTVNVQDSNGLGTSGTGNFVDPATPVTMDFTLPAAGTVTGTVRDAHGNPVANEYVSINTSGPNSAFRFTTTDASGVYRAEKVAIGDVYASVYVNGLSAYATGTLANDGDTITLDLTLPAGGTVTGHVYAADGTTPVENVSVLLINTDGGMANTGAYTAADGSFTATGVPVGNIRVEALTQDQGLAGVANIKVAQDATTTIDIVMGNAVVNPVNLVGSDLFLYDIGCDGTMTTGGKTDNSATAAFDYMGGIQVGNSYYPACNNLVGIELGGRQAIVGPASTDGLRLTRKIFVPSSGGFVRYLEVLENQTDTAITADVSMYGNVTTSTATHLVIGPTDTNNTYGVLDANATCCAPATGYVYAGANSTVPTAAYINDGNSNVSHSWSVTVPANQTVIIMHFVVQRNYDNALGAKSQAASLADLSDPNALSGMTTTEKSQVVNFIIP